MRRLITAALFALAPAVAHAVDLPVRLRDGATWTQTILHTRTDVRAGATTSRTATTVLKPTYIGGGGMRLAFVSFAVEGADADAMKAFAGQASAAYPATLDVDDALRPIRVRDWQRQQQAMVQAASAAAADPKVLQGMQAMFAGMTDTQAATLFREQALVSIGQGKALNVGETVTYASEMPNPMGGPTISATGAFKLEAIDTAKGVATVSWSQRPDPASLAASLRVSMDTMVARLAPETRAEAQAALATLTLERQEACRFEIDVATGLATTADCTVEIKNGVKDQLAQRTDRWIITQSLPESR